MEADRGDPDHQQGIYVMNADGTNAAGHESHPPVPGWKAAVLAGRKALVFTRFRGKDRPRRQPCSP